MWKIWLENQVDNWVEKLGGKIGWKNWVEKLGGQVRWKIRRKIQVEHQVEEQGKKWMEKLGGKIGRNIWWKIGWPFWVVQCILYSVQYTVEKCYSFYRGSPVFLSMSGAFLPGSGFASPLQRKAVQYSTVKYSTGYQRTADSLLLTGR